MPARTEKMKKMKKMAKMGKIEKMRGAVPVRKRAVSLLLAVLMAAGILAGCGTGNSAGTTSAATTAATTAASTEAATSAAADTATAAQGQAETTTAAQAQAQSQAEPTTAQTTQATQATQAAQSAGDTAGGADALYDIFNVSLGFDVDGYIAAEKARWNLGRDVEFNWYFNYNHHYGTKPWKEYTALRVASEITGIDATGDIPTGDPQEKVRLMMANNSLPDLVTLGTGDPLGKELIAGGYLVAVEDILKEYEPGFWENIPKSLKGVNTFPDYENKMWSFTGLTPPQWQLDAKKNVGTYAYSVRRDIWEDLGSPSIATPDDLYNTLRLFKDTYPEMNGKSSIALGTYTMGLGIIDCMGYSWGVGRSNFADLNNIEPRYTHPGFTEMVVFLNKLMRDGLLDPEFFIRDDQQAIEALTTCVFMLPYVFHAPDPASNILNEQKPNSGYVAIPPMSATGKPFHAAGGVQLGGAVQTYVSMNCKDLAAAARLIAYGFSDWGTMQVCQGTPGIHWISENGEFFRPDDVVAEINKDGAAYNNVHGLWDYYPLWYAPMPNKGQEPENRQMDRANSDPYAYDPTCEWFNMAPDPSSDAGIAQQSIEILATREYPRAVISAQSEAECRQIMEQLVSDIKATRDFDKLCAYLTNQYKENVAQFGGPAY